VLGDRASAFRKLSPDRDAKLGSTCAASTFLIGLGWSLADAPLGLVPTALLAVLIDRKAQREETWLIERFPDYALYRAHTPRRFVPWLY
jgi:protein-S-isoprenylcysteine O-methyltransferase Ste14